VIADLTMMLAVQSYAGKTREPHDRELHADHFRSRRPSPVRRLSLLRFVLTVIVISVMVHFAAMAGQSADSRSTPDGLCRIDIRALILQGGTRLDRQPVTSE
jgi:hypothetical protein